MPVGFVTKLLIKVPSFSFFDINTSSKLIPFSKYYMVNFMEGRKLFRNPKNSFKFSRPLVYIQKISSKHRNQT